MAIGDKIYFVDEIVGALHPSVKKIETEYCSTSSGGAKTLVEKTGRGVLYLGVPDQQSVTYTITVDGVVVCTNSVLSYSTAVTNYGGELPIPFNESIKVVSNAPTSYIVRYTVVFY